MAYKHNDSGREVLRASNARFKAHNPEKVATASRKSHLKLNYNMTLRQYADVLAAQNGVCAICGKPSVKQKLNVDHNHATGKLRGLLCWKCNVGIGHFDEDLSSLRKAIKYLEKYEVPVNQPEYFIQH